MFNKVNLKQPWPAIEEEILACWEREKVFQKSLELNQGKPKFVFYEGPPTANGKPGIHHVLARIYKDLVCRYKSMQGYYVPRKAGWDTHGLPVELEVEKRLKISGKHEIEEYGIDRFIEECKKSIFTYKEDWDQNTKRIGYWLDLEHPYITCDNNYIESIWWALKEVFNQGLITRGHKVVPHCPRCQTTLSSHEVAQGYDDHTVDPSVFVKFPLKEEKNAFFLVWTTTPWTLTANIALAVNPKEQYLLVKNDTESLILSKKRFLALKEAMEPMKEYEIAKEMEGSQLLEKKYDPLFPYGGREAEEKGNKVIPADFVGMEEGTGIVHLAPAFGADDMNAGMEHNLPVILTVDLNGYFNENAPDFKGKFIKDGDPLILKDLKKRNLLFHSTTLVHTYPFCWRCNSPLVYYAKNSWFLKTRSIREKLMEMNEKIQWYPSHIKNGRFGEWLKDAKDWAISRERYWGTPLNIWECNACSHVHPVGSIKELEALSKANLDNIDLHRPYIDEVTLKCEKCGSTMHRVKEVLDCWLDSGSMPFAQFHYPFECSDFLEQYFPADFISEGIDQTRGWFFTLLVMNGVLFGESPYRSVLTFELVLDEKGEKMSKSRGNVVDVNEMIDQFGSDAIRWSMFFSSTPYVPRRFSSSIVSDGLKNFILPLLNVCSFFVTYANIDGWSYDKLPDKPPFAKSLMDQWMISRLEKLINEVAGSMDQIDITDASKKIAIFVDDLTNWYIRRCRRRFWKSENDADKNEAYQTLFYVLYRFNLLIAPFVPFLSEYLYQIFLSPLKNESFSSIHYNDYPTANLSAIDENLDQNMEQVRQWISAGLHARKKAGYKVRFPLASIRIISENDITLSSEMKQIIQDELNIKEILFEKDLSRYAEMKLKPHLPTLGKKHGKMIPLIKEALNNYDQPFDLMEAIEKTGKTHIKLSNGEDVLLDKEDLIREIESSSDQWEVALAQKEFVVLDIQPDENLIAEGIARELVHAVQNMRKEADYEVTDSIRLGFCSDANLIDQTFMAHQSYIKAETLSKNIESNPEWKADLNREVQIKTPQGLNATVELFITRFSA